MKHVPKHRGAPQRPDLIEKPAKAIGTTMVFTSVAVAATGTTIAGGLFAAGSPAVAVAGGEGDAGTRAVDHSSSDSSADLGAAATADPVRADLAAATYRVRLPQVSRSADRRDDADPLKEAALAEPTGPTGTGSEDLADADPRDIAMALLSEFGFSSDQFGCLDSLYMRESGWNVYADNPSSSAYGIPQALPGSKMASAGADWATNPVTQIRWGLGYIQDRYGSPCGAWGHSQSYGWY